MNPDGLSRPERSANRGCGKELREKVKQAGGCWYCVHRDQRNEGWDRAVCSRPRKTFPKCVTDESGASFELDEARA